jgi:hypothetical protein
MRANDVLVCNGEQVTFLDSKFLVWISDALHILDYP